MLNSKLFFSTKNTTPAKIKTAEPKIDKIESTNVIIETLIWVESNFLTPVLNKNKILIKRKIITIKINNKTTPRRTFKHPITVNEMLFVLGKASSTERIIIVPPIIPRINTKKVVNVILKIS